MTTNRSVTRWERVLVVDLDTAVTGDLQLVSEDIQEAVSVARLAVELARED